MMKKENNDLEKLLQDESLTGEQKVQAINKYFNDYRKSVDDELNKYILRQNIGAAVEIGSAAIPFGAGAKSTEIGYKLVEPLAATYGKKIPERIAQGIVGGTVAGTVHGIGSSIANPDKNPIVEVIKDTVGGTLVGSLGGVGLSKAEQYLRGGMLKYLAGKQGLSRDKLQRLRRDAKDYYNDYIKDTTVKRDNNTTIKFGNVGINEQISKGLHNVGILPDLKKQIQTGVLKGMQKDYPREDIKQFHIIENSLKNKNYEYQIAQDVNGYKYYLVKDGKNVELPQASKNLNPKQVAPFFAPGENSENPSSTEVLKGYIQKSDSSFENIPIADPVKKSENKKEQSGTGHIFTPSEIGKMTGEEFTQHEQNIMEQVKNGLIKPDNQQKNFSGYTNPVNGSRQIFSKENIESMSTEDYTKNEKAINAQLNSIGIPSDEELQTASKSGGGTVYVKSYTRSDGTKVQGYYRSL